jgi:phosphoribosylpyrophosphate synthetase
VPIDKSKQYERLKILSVGELFGRAIMRIHNEESISLLFD